MQVILNQIKYKKTRKQDKHSLYQILSTHYHRNKKSPACMISCPVLIMILLINQTNLIKVHLCSTSQLLEVN